MRYFFERTASVGNWEMVAIMMINTLTCNYVRKKQRSPKSFLYSDVPAYKVKQAHQFSSKMCKCIQQYRTLYQSNILTLKISLWDTINMVRLHCSINVALR